MHPSPSFVTQILYSYPLKVYYENGTTLDAGKDVLNRYFHNATWWEELPRGWAGWHSLNTNSLTSNYGGYLGTLEGSLVYTGGIAEEAQDLSDEFNALDVPYGGCTFVNYESLLSYVEYGTGNAGSYYRQFIGNVFVGADVLPEGDTTLTDTVVDPLVNLAYNGGSMNFFANNVLGGAVGDTAEKDTAVGGGFRRALFEIGPNEAWVDPAYDSYFNSLSASLSKDLYNLSNASYVNEWSTIPNEYNDFPDWKTRFWGGNYDRLLEIKMRYDPCNFLVVPKGIASDEPINTCYNANMTL